MPQSHQRYVESQIQIERELESLELWLKKTRGVTSFDWDGDKLTLQSERGSEVFDRKVVEAVIFANFRPELQTH